MFSPLLIILTYFGATQAFYFSSRKMDCVVSEWSEWDGPLSDGRYKRYRSVLVHPVNGGDACPVLSETASSGSPGTNAGVHVGIDENNSAANFPTINKTAQAFKDDFIENKDGNNIYRFVRSPTSNTESYRKTRDILLLIDASGSIGEGNFKKALEGVSDLLRLLCPEPDPFFNPSLNYHQAAAIRFDTIVTEIFHFGEKYPTSTLVDAIRGISYTAGGTCTAEAFRAAIKFFSSNYKGVRNSNKVQKEVLILTDGESNCGGNAIDAAMELKNTIFSSADDKVKVYALAIGIASQSGRAELKKYVSDPPGQHLFAVSGFDELLSVVNETKKLLDKETNRCVPIEVPPDPLVG